MSKRNTWSQVERLLNAGARYGMSVSVDDSGRRYLSDNNGCLLTRNPTAAMNGILSMRATGGTVFRATGGYVDPASL